MNLAIFGRNTRSVLISRNVLEHHAATISVEHDFHAICRLVDANHLDGLIIDCANTGIDPLEAVQALRERTDVPLFVIVPNDDEINRVLLLELGADDCIDSAISPRELLARVRSVLRRMSENGKPATPGHILEAADIRLYRGSFQVEVNGRPCQLTTAEFRMLERLMLADGSVVTREELAAYGLGRALPVEDRSVDVHMSRLRRKLGNPSSGATRIRSLRGRGYMLVCTG